MHVSAGYREAAADTIAVIATTTTTTYATTTTCATTTTYATRRVLQAAAFAGSLESIMIVRLAGGSPRPWPRGG